MELVHCTEPYWEFVRLLRMDRRVQSGFIQTTYVTPDMQIAYMTKYADCYRVALFNGLPAGYVGVIEGDIRVCTHPDFQGKGLGKFMITECMNIWPTAFAKVKLDNEASINLFESCGFTKKFYIMTKEH